MTTANIIEICVLIVILVVGSITKYKTRQKVKSLDGFGTICTNEALKGKKTIAIETLQDD